MNQMIVRMVGFAALAVLISLALAWVVEQIPALGWLLTALSFAFLAWTIVSVMRSPKPLIAIAAVAGTFVLAVGLAALMSAVTGSDEAVVAAPAPADGTTDGEAVASDAGEETEPAGEEPGPAGDDAGTVTTTTAAENGPDTADPSTTTTTSTTTSAAPPSFAFTDPTDCACNDELTGLTLALVGTDLRIDVAGDAPLGGPLMVWSLSQPGRIASVEVAPGEPGMLSATLADAGSGPWAIVSAGADRVPDLGFLDEGGSLVSVGDQGAEAAAIEASVAEIQRLAPALSPDVQAFVGSLLYRQIAEGTTTLRQEVAGQADVEVLVTVANQYPASGQVVTADGQVIGRSHLGAMAQTFCAPDGGGPLVCEPGDYPQTLTAAQAIVADPSGLVVEPLDPPEPGVVCLRIVAAPAGGPSLGDTCWASDGQFVSLVRATDTVTLESFVPTADPAVLLAPEVS